MTNSPAPKSIRSDLPLARAFLFTVLGLTVVATACTPATPDTTPVTGAGGSAAGSTTGAGTGGSGASGASVGTSSGGSMAPGGSPGDGNGGSPSSGAGGLAVSGSGGSSPVGSGGTSATGLGGSVGAGGSPAVGAGGTVGAGGAAATGCNWVQNADGTWAFGTPAPADKIVLFDGTTLAGWHKENMPGVPIGWMLVAGGAMQVVPSGTGQATEVQSDMKFSDLCVHVEYMTPVFPSSTTDTQKQGNSGVYLRSAYEMQILDTSKDGPLDDGCGAVYKVAAPLVVACYQYLIWNTYEIEFKSSVWDATGKKTKDAVMVKVALNGKIVQLNIDLNPTGGTTQAGVPDAPGPQPLGLQDHLDLVQFRNIWVTIPKY
jgi:hypothetical protein